MAVRELCYFDDKTLRKKSKNIDKVDGIIVRLLEDMAETMYARNGVGLAAPQVGVLKRCITVDVGDNLLKVINPKIVKSEGLVEATEGCLSLPNIFGDVDRAEKVTVKGLDENGEPFKIDAEGMLARVFQHEIDHLDGTLFIDKARNVREILPEDQVCGFEEEEEGGEPGADQGSAASDASAASAGAVSAVHAGSAASTASADSASAAHAGSAFEASGAFAGHDASGAQAPNEASAAPVAEAPRARRKPHPAGDVLTCYEPAPGASSQDNPSR